MFLMDKNNEWSFTTVLLSAEKFIQGTIPPAAHFNIG